MRRASLRVAPLLTAACVSLSAIACTAVSSDGDERLEKQTATDKQPEGNDGAGSSESEAPADPASWAALRAKVPCSIAEHGEDLRVYLSPPGKLAFANRWGLSSPSHPTLLLTFTSTSQQIQNPFPEAFRTHWTKGNVKDIAPAYDDPRKRARYEHSYGTVVELSATQTYADLLEHVEPRGYHREPDFLRETALWQAGLGCTDDAS